MKKTIVALALLFAAPAAHAQFDEKAYVEALGNFEQSVAALNQVLAHKAVRFWHTSYTSDVSLKDTLHLPEATLQALAINQQGLAALIQTRAALVPLLEQMDAAVNTEFGDLGEDKLRAIKTNLLEAGDAANTSYLLDHDGRRLLADVQAAPVATAFRAAFLKQIDSLIAYERAAIPYYQSLAARVKQAGDSLTRVRDIQESLTLCALPGYPREQLPPCGQADAVPYQLGDTEIGYDQIDSYDGFYFDSVGKMKDSPLFASVLTLLRGGSMAMRLSNVPVKIDPATCDLSVTDDPYLSDNFLTPISKNLFRNLYREKPVTVVCRAKWFGDVSIDFDAQTRTVAYTYGRYFGGSSVNKKMFVKIGLVTDLLEQKLGQ